MSSALSAADGQMECLRVSAASGAGPLVSVAALREELVAAAEKEDGNVGREDIVVR